MKRYAEGGVYTAEMGKPPQDIDGASVAKAPAKPTPSPKTAPEPKGIRGGVWTKDSGVPVPQDIDGASVTQKKPKKMASGGTASSRADGIAQRGKTRGKVC